MKLVWLGRILSYLVMAFLFLDAVIHILYISAVAKASLSLGLPASMSLIIGIIELLCVALYVYPKTSVLGAILLTGYLGGAVATNLRVGMPLFSNTLFPVYTGLFVWGGLFLREKRVKDLIPFKR